MLEGHLAGHLEGLKFVADESEDSIAAHIEELEACGPEAIRLDETGTILWRETPVGRVVRGADILHPEAEVTASGLLEGSDRERVRKRLGEWLRAHVTSTLEPLALARKAEIGAPARGIAFRLTESLGQLAGRPLEKEINALTDDERKDLSALGIRFGVVTVYMPAILKPAQQRLKAVLFSVNANLPQVPPMPPAGRVSFPPEPDMPPGFYEVLGYCILGGLVVRVDMVERFAADARRLTRDGPAVMPPENLSILGIGAAAAKGLLGDLGFDLEADETGKLTLSRKKATVRRDSKKRPPPRKKPAAKAVKKESPPKPPPQIDENSPFAKLRELKFK